MVQCCGMVEVATALGCRRGQWMYESWKGGEGEVEVFYKGEEFVQSHHLSLMPAWCRISHQICRWHQIERAVDVLEGRAAVWRDSDRETSWYPVRANTSSVPGNEELLADMQAGAWWVWAQLCWKGPVGPGGQQAKHEPGFKQSTASWAALVACRLRQVIILLYLALVSPRPEYSIPFGGWDVDFV